MLSQNLDLSIMIQTQFDGSFPNCQFQMGGYKYLRMASNNFGGALCLYVIMDIPSK